jgi:hypothetical protein
LQLRGRNGGRVAEPGVDDEKSGLLAVFLDTLKNPGVKRMQKVAIAKDERDDRRRVARKNLGARVRPVVQLFEGSLNALAQLGVDVRLIIHDARNGADGDSGATGDIANGHSHSAGTVEVFMNPFMKKL